MFRLKQYDVLKFPDTTLFKNIFQTKKCLCHIRTSSAILC